MLLEVLTILLLILANGVFAMSEMAIVSARRARLQELAEQGDRQARAALALANSPNRFLSTVQVGITLIGILAGAFGGATLSRSFAGYIAQIPGVGQYSEAIAFGLVVMVITYLSLIVGELVPKRLALHSPEKIASSIAQPMQWVAKLASPIVTLLTSSTELVLRLLRVNPNEGEPLVTEEEIKVLLRQGAQAGTFEASEQDMVERVFSLGDRQVSAIMTPRLDIIWLDMNDSYEINRRKMIESHHNRFPVCLDSLDNVLGVVYVTDILNRSLSNHPIDFTALLRPPLFVPESTRAPRVLELFKQLGTHIAFVVDEYGITQGIVTLNDVMEIIIGDIPFADQPQEAEFIQREDGSWLIDGMLPIHELKELFEINELPGEDRGNYQTMGGFIITQLGHIPKSSDHFEWEGFRFEVMDMDGNRVDKVLVIPPGKVGEPGAGGE
ncbi:hemolysin family protein [Leptolyngbya sp. FACHB-711]|uniref:hemolysin family protein n=1 Tax=unclassified Leptolyngbya TaxID=2650499 RepID=UPI0016827669|nr:hemolysin family protein [Leptolyngbya sp. FACHB-711]MBD1851539.1 HlyC/CorC family transporter [Cyanobacteria bacterium FACHB-502]MBD2022818.1 HlyC/CorC family transporter [Leptolyngbya sp. FACHB-711]